MGGTTPNRNIRYPYASDSANAVATYFFQLASDVDTAMGPHPPTFTALTLAAGAAVAGAYAPASCLLPSGKVELRGQFTTPAAGGFVLATLPTGQRPAANVSLATAVNWNTSTTANCQITVGTSGDITVYVPTGNTSASLDGLWFYIA